MNDFINILTDAFNTVVSSSLGMALIGLFLTSFMLSALVRCLRVSVMESPRSYDKQKNDNKNVVVGHLMTDDEKIAYIIDTDKDIESASDRIADIYFKQMGGNE